MLLVLIVGVPKDAGIEVFVGKVVALVVVDVSEMKALSVNVVTVRSRSRVFRLRGWWYG